MEPQTVHKRLTKLMVKCLKTAQLKNPLKMENVLAILIQYFKFTDFSVNSETYSISTVPFMDILIVT